jgi:hypothetical protein
VYNAINSVKVGGKSAIVASWGKYKFGETLDRVGWVACEVASKSRSYRGEQVEDL